MSAKLFFPNDFVRFFNNMAENTYQVNVDHGFEGPNENFGMKIALVHSELSEALEYYRKDEATSSDHIPGFTGIEEEFADVIIRLMNMGVSKGLRVAEAIVAKNEFNRARPYRHGGKKS